MTPVKADSPVVIRKLRRCWASIASTCLILVALFLFAAQQWKFTAVSACCFVAGAIALWVISWHRGSKEKKQKLVRVLVHTFVTYATLHAVATGLALIGLMLSGDNPAPGSFGLKVAYEMEEWWWLIGAFFASVANVATWALYKVFTSDERPNQALQHNAGMARSADEALPPRG
jgi:hypothetical protein